MEPAQEALSVQVCRFQWHLFELCLVFKTAGRQPTQILRCILNGCAVVVEEPHKPFGFSTVVRAPP